MGTDPREGAAVCKHSIEVFKEHRSVQCLYLWSGSRVLSCGHVGGADGGGGVARGSHLSNADRHAHCKT